NFEETVKFNDLAFRLQVLIRFADIDVYHSALKLGMRHLAGNGAFPYKIIQPGFLCVFACFMVLEISRPYGFVSFLGAGCFSAVIPWKAVLLAVSPVDLGSCT